jgi:hypothetical protein
MLRSRLAWTQFPAAWRGIEEPVQAAPFFDMVDMNGRDARAARVALFVTLYVSFGYPFEDVMRSRM